MVDLALSGHHPVPSGHELQPHGLGMKAHSLLFLPSLLGKSFDLFAGKPTWREKALFPLGNGGKGDSQLPRQVLLGESQFGPDRFDVDGFFYHRNIDIILLKLCQEKFSVWKAFGKRIFR